MIDRSELRPLGVFSNFVVEEMPQRLAAVLNGHIKICSLTQRGLSLLPQENLTQVANLDLATLDLKMFERAIVQFGEQTPRELASLIDEASARVDQPQGITYEEIILINPHEDPRTFTHGEIGETEKHFYQSHAKIETHLGRVISSVTETIEDFNQGTTEPEVAGSIIREKADDLTQVIDHTHSVGTQFREHFEVFREYLKTHPTRGLKGPSGAFTARIPALEILLAGEQLPQDYLIYLDDNRNYFPRDGRLLLDYARDLANRGLSLTSIAETLGRPEALMNPIIQLSSFLHRFRGEHYKAVRNQIPEAISGKIAGTAGEADPGTFLRNRMKIRHI